MVADDVDELNGTTIIVPGSHKLKFAPEDNAKDKKNILKQKGFCFNICGCLCGASKKYDGLDGH